MARIGAAMKCIQFMLFTLNFMFVLVGALLTTVGVVIIRNYWHYPFIDTSHFKPAEIMVACGIILLIVSVFGCVGAMRQSTLMTNIYWLLLFIVLIIEIAGAATAFSMRDTIAEDIETIMKGTLDYYKKIDSIRTEWDLMQENLRCCGVDNPRNWATQHIDGPIVNMGGHVFTIPYSCCEDEAHCSRFYDRGCFSSLGDYATDATFFMVYVGAGVGVGLLFSVIFACVLAKGIRKAKTVQEIDRQQNRRIMYEQALRRNPVSPLLRVSAYS